MGMLRRTSEAAVTDFLRDALTADAVGVPKLDAMAREAGLLGERQHVTNAKGFRRAKRSLGLRSVRDDVTAHRLSKRKRRMKPQQSANRETTIEIK